MATIQKNRSAKKVWVFIYIETIILYVPYTKFVFLVPFGFTMTYHDNLVGSHLERLVNDP